MGQLYASGMIEARQPLLRAVDGEVVYRPLLQHFRVAFSPDGRLLATDNQGGALVWRLAPAAPSADLDAAWRAFAAVSRAFGTSAGAIRSTKSARDTRPVPDASNRATSASTSPGRTGT